MQKTNIFFEEAPGSVGPSAFMFTPLQSSGCAAAQKAFLHGAFNIYRLIDVIGYLHRAQRMAAIDGLERK